MAWRNQRRRGPKLEVTRPKNDYRYYLTLGTLWPEFRATIHSMHAASRTLLFFAFNETQPPFSSSVEIDVIESSRVVRSEHLLEFYFACIALLNFSICGN